MRWGLLEGIAIPWGGALPLSSACSRIASGHVWELKMLSLRVRCVWYVVHAGCLRRLRVLWWCILLWLVSWGLEGNLLLSGLVAFGLL